MTAPLTLHYFFSCLTASLIVFAALHSALILWQDKRLKHPELSHCPLPLPSIEQSGRRLYLLLMLGLTGLTLCLLTAPGFLDPQLTIRWGIKITFSVLAWGLFFKIWLDYQKGRLKILKAAWQTWTVLLVLGIIYLVSFIT